LIVAAGLTAGRERRLPRCWRRSTAEADPAPEAHEILVMLRMPAQHFAPTAATPAATTMPRPQAARRRTAEAIARENGLELLEGWPMPLVGVDCYVMRVPEGARSTRSIAEVSRNAWSPGRSGCRPTRPGAGPATIPFFPPQPAASAVAAGRHPPRSDGADGVTDRR
jgi:hypothetical protein